MIDLSAYFARIGYNGPRDATLPVLEALHLHHALAIPFENLDSFLGQAVGLGLPSLSAKLITRRRGGYCYEQNSLFHAVLTQLGFTVTCLSARILWGRPPEAGPSPRGHMALEVTIAGTPYLVDVGFGGQLFAAPLPMEPNAEQSSLAAHRRMLLEGHEWSLQTQLDEVWAGAYNFTREPFLPQDFEAANWYTCTHPQSLFRENLMLQRLTADQRISLLGRRVRRRNADGKATDTQLSNVREFARLLEQDFAIEPPADPAEIFARLPDGG